MTKTCLFWGMTISYFIISFFHKVLDIKVLGSFQIFLENLPIYLKIILHLLLVCAVFVLYPYKTKQDRK